MLCPALVVGRACTDKKRGERESMSTVNMVKTIKKIYPSCVILVKIGNFYNVYGKDAYIFSYLFDYSWLARIRIVLKRKFFYWLTSSNFF